MNRVKVLSIVAGVVVFANIIKLIMMGQGVLVAVIGLAIVLGWITSPVNFPRLANSPRLGEHKQITIAPEIRDKGVING